jgi:hypothetical protein
MERSATLCDRRHDGKQPRAIRLQSPIERDGPLIAKQEMTMSKFEQPKADQIAVQLDDEALNTVVGGAATDWESFLAQNSVGGWYMKDVFAKPQIGRYSPR